MALKIEEDSGVRFDIILQALESFYAADIDTYVCNPISLFKSCGENGEWYLQWMSRYYKVSEYKLTWALHRDDILPKVVCDAIKDMIAFTQEYKPADFTDERYLNRFNAVTKKKK